MNDDDAAVTLPPTFEPGGAMDVILRMVWDAAVASCGDESGAQAVFHRARWMIFSALPAKG